MANLKFGHPGSDCGDACSARRVFHRWREPSILLAFLYIQTAFFHGLFHETALKQFAHAHGSVGGRGERKAQAYAPLVDRRLGRNLCVSVEHRFRACSVRRPATCQLNASMQNDGKQM